MLPPTAISMSSIRNDVIERFRQLAGDRPAASVSPRNPRSGSANSSPPSLATVSAARMAPWSRGPTSLEQLVATVVTEGVVHLLEAVQVHAA